MAEGAPSYGQARLAVSGAEAAVVEDAEIVERLAAVDDPSFWRTPRSPGRSRRQPDVDYQVGDLTTDRVHTGSVRQVIRLPEPKIRPEVEARRKAGADILRPYRGRFVGQKGEQVLIDADNPYDVVNWLREHGIDGATVFRVPLDPTVDTLTAVGPTDPPEAAGP